MKLEFTTSMDDIKDASIISSKTNPIIKKKRIFFNRFILYQLY
ncbi:hypothetical protein SAMN02745196_01997 [Clostridium collagenovorans DSM 3089]|uniref:Uncharacterized protein n=1 Tax=Clostridium collagenovorans DSM 3089 TaxID=1121306 RepID=A0A1M5X4J9_9CLOT|nr:hypothetical protein [Clostridium collagenovorans]SHH94731.1 hypothetical protein SAMN02745196_01997 [Clostridium collagenovorans DSM 3089]